jgi:hypothetical protein
MAEGVPPGYHGDDSGIDSAAAPPPAGTLLAHWGRSGEEAGKHETRSGARHVWAVAVAAAMRRRYVCGLAPITSRNRHPRKDLLVLFELGANVINR